MTNIFCPMIHGGLNVNLKANSKLGYNQCCLSTTPLTFVEKDSINWTSKDFVEIRQTNTSNQWLSGCWQCETLEKVGVKSFREAMIDKFGSDQNLLGPRRIDLLFDRSCNLACRTCSPSSSTFWEKHLKDNNLLTMELPPTDNVARVHSILSNLNLENLGMVQFCGGETLLGNSYWQTAQLLAELIPNSKTQLELGFQTNGTQTIDSKWFEVIEKFKIVKLLVSLDGVGKRFEYLRWPASWNQVTDNILHLKETLPSNVMFFVQECTSCLNLYYYNEVHDWANSNFATNREGDAIGYTTQLAEHPYLNVATITQEYVDAIAHTPMINVIKSNWKENPTKIKMFINETAKFDKFRGQNWKKVFPEVAEFYKRYI